MLRVGLVGFPNVGKSTVFNALTRLSVPTAPFPFTTVDPHRGMVAVPDPVLASLGKVFRAERVTPAAFELIDVAGLVKGAHRGEGLGNEFLSHLRRADVILHVVRMFQDERVAKAGGSAEPEEDIQAIQAELAAKDKEIAARHAKTKEKDLPRPLSSLPALYLFNLGEKEISSPPSQLPALLKKFRPSAALAAKIEAELAELPPDERRVFAREYALDSSAVPHVIASLIALAKQKIFYTVNQNEARAWLVPQDTDAVSAAGFVHSQFAERFVRAEAVSADLMLKLGSWQRVREMGKARILKRNSPVPPGAVLLFHDDARG